MPDECPLGEIVDRYWLWSANLTILTGSIRLDARLEPSAGFAELSGKVINSDNKPVADATILLSSAYLNRHYNARADWSGKFLFPEVEIGDDYRLRAMATDSYREFVQQDLIVAGDDNDLLIVLEPRDIG